MTSELQFHLGFSEGREWAVNWAGEDVLQRCVTGAGNFAAAGTNGGFGGSTGNVPLGDVTALLVGRPLAATERQAFWQEALPDADPALVQSFDFLCGFLAGTRSIAQEPL